MAKIAPGSGFLQQREEIENANSSEVLEELGVRSIPHYMINNPEGKLVSGFAERPGKGAKKQLEALLY